MNQSACDGPFFWYWATTTLPIRTQQQRLSALSSFTPQRPFATVAPSSRTTPSTLIVRFQRFASGGGRPLCLDQSERRVSIRLALLLLLLSPPPPRANDSGIGVAPRSGQIRVNGAILLLTANNGCGGAGSNRPTNASRARAFL
jgi:hypothetical protein